MCGSTPDVETPAKVPEAPTMPSVSTKGTTASRDARRRSTAAGRNTGGFSTLLTGMSASQSAGKTLLGQ